MRLEFYHSDAATLYKPDTGDISLCILLDGNLETNLLLLRVSGDCLHICPRRCFVRIILLWNPDRTSPVQEAKAGVSGVYSPAGKEKWQPLA